MNKQTEQYLLDLVKRNYEKIADDFNISRKKYLWPELIKLTAPVKNGNRVLDVGCGNGRLIEAFAGKNISYIGVDNNEKLIKAARENFQTVNNANTKFVLGDILKLNKILDKYFDYIFCIALLHHLPGKNLQAQALEQMKEKIKQNGKIIITVWNLWSRKKFTLLNTAKGNSTGFRKLILKFSLLKILGKNKMDFGDIIFSWKNNKKQEISKRYYHAFTKNELKKLAIRAGLKIEKLYKDKYNYYLIANLP